MKPRTVRVPEGMEGVFVEAERVIDAFFRAKREQPEQGTIEIAGERYILVRAASLSVELFRVVRELYGEGRSAEADAFSRNILFDLAHAVGRSDARVFAGRVGGDDPIARLSAGPVHFAYTGWANVDISRSSRPTPDDDYFLLYDHPYSFESEAWIATSGGAQFPVCIMNAGYSAGWCSQSFGLMLVASEVMCRARGDEACRFVMAPPGRIEEHVARWRRDAERGGTPPRGVDRYAIPDLFARKRLEEELERARVELEDRVRERTAELERANAMLRREMDERERVERQLRQSQKMEAIGRLAGGIAHDFNNVLGVILGYSSVLAPRVGPDGPVREGLDAIADAARRAAELTRQLLALSRAQIQTSEALDLRRVVLETSELLRRLVGDDVRLETALGPDTPMIWANATGIQQVILNLVVNARDAMPEGGTLTLRTGREEVGDAEASGLAAGPYASLIVDDTGVGMDEATRDRIFDPFFTTKGPGKGTGLGLSTVYGIVSQVGGAITVTSAPGLGTRFRVLFPAFDGAPRPRTRDSAPPVAGHGTGARVLVVEDDASLRAIVARMIALEGYTVETATDAGQAMARVLEGGVPDVLVTDVMMPGTSGPELARRLRARAPDLPVLFVSGHADVDELRRGVDDERTACLAKPFTSDALAKALSRLLLE